MLAHNSTISQTLLCMNKADLHVHFEGSATHETLESLTRERTNLLYSPIRLGKKEIRIPENFDFAATSFPDFRNFAVRYLKTVDLIRTTDDVLQIGTAYLESAKQQNIIASQVYFTPSTFKLMGKELKPLFIGLKEVEKVASSEYGAQISWIFDIARNSPQPPEETLELALHARSLGVSVNALGLAGDERCKHVSFYAATFAKARSLGLQLLAHAGEGTSPGSIIETIKHLNPSRIGHGISATRDLTCVQKLKESQIAVEVSPWSNICMNITSTDSHPIRSMIEHGLDVVIASDDPGIFGKTLHDNYLFAHEAGVSLEQLTQISKRSLELASFTAKTI